MKEKLIGKVIHVLELLTYISIGISIIILRDKHIESIANLIGFTILFYGIIDIIREFTAKRAFTEETRIFDSLVLIILSVVLLFFIEKDFTKACVIWGVWAIFREADELRRCFINAKKKAPFILNGIESIVLIILSIMLINNPEHHAYFHVIILGIEFILEAVFEIFNEAVLSLISKKSE